MTIKPDLRTCRLELQLVTTIDTPEGKVDLYALHRTAENAITLGVPHGRQDIANFVIRCVRAGQNLMQAMPPGTPFAPDQVMPFGLRRRQ